MFFGILSLNGSNQIVDVANQIVTDPTTTGNVVAGGDTTVVNSIVYVGVSGGAEIPGVGGVQIYLGFSQLGPLTLFLKAEFPLILDPIIRHRHWRIRSRCGFRSSAAAAKLTVRFA